MPKEDKVTFGELWLGDRFTSGGHVWTKIDFGEARHHSNTGIELGRKGYGYRLDSICRFGTEEVVSFISPKESL